MKARHFRSRETPTRNPYVSCDAAGRRDLVASSSGRIGRGDSSIMRRSCASVWRRLGRPGSGCGAGRALHTVPLVPSFADGLIEKLPGGKRGNQP